MKTTVLALLLLLSISLAFAGPGVVFVDGYINDVPVRFLVDTGADEISIPYSEAIRIGLPVFSGPRTESTTASGTVGVYKMTLDSVTVGNITVPHVAAHVSESDLGVPTVLLGMSFLSRVKVCFQNGRLMISNP